MIDINNANVRVFLQKEGMYPGAAGKIVKNAPFKSKEDMYAKAGFTPEERNVTKFYDGNFIFLEPQVEFVVDQFNNGLYRR